MEYTAVIRTLGRAGEKYQTLLKSLESQTIPPRAILVYIAEGYPLPKETICKERYIYVTKGMVAQRALQYKEVNTEYILFLDDDVYLPDNSVALLFKQMLDNGADVISPDVFHNSKRPFLQSLLMAISGRMYPRKKDDVWGYKVMRTGGYSYNMNPTKSVYRSQTNAGPCFLCKKRDFLNIHFEVEMWLDQVGYPQGEDQVMFYKMYKAGYNQLTSNNSGIVNLDAGQNRDKTKEKMLIYSDFRFKTIFWHRFIFKPTKNRFLKAWNVLAIAYTFMFALLISLIKFRFDIMQIKCSAIKDGIEFIRSDEYKSLPLI